MNNHQREEFLRRIVAFQDNGLSEDELASFDRELREDSEKRAIFIEAQNRSAAIGEYFREEAFTVDEAPTSRLPSHRYGAWLSIAGLALAGCVAVLFLALAPGTTAPPAGSALLTYAEHAHWEDASPIEGGYLAPGVEYLLDAGSVRLEMGGGAIVSLAGPASFMIEDEDVIALRSGKLTARMPHEESEILVRAGDLEIRDLGTAFGVTADLDGDVDLAVFDGSVEVRSTEGAEQEVKETLVEGEAFSSSGDASDMGDTLYDSRAYQDIWPLTIGVDDASNLVDFVPPGPNAPLDELTNDHKLFLMPERLNKRMRMSLTFNLVEPGQAWPVTRAVPHTIPRGTSVSSYLVMYNPESSEYRNLRALSGSISFQHRIIGVAVSPEQLSRTDRVFGVPGINYQSMQYRPLEDEMTEEGDLPPDSLRISDDGRRLYFNLYVGAGRDHLRVLVDDNSADRDRQDARSAP